MEEFIALQTVVQGSGSLTLQVLARGCLDTAPTGTLIHTEAGLTGTSWTYLEADEIAESGLGRLNNHLRVKIRRWGASHTHVAIREIEWEFDRV